MFVYIGGYTTPDRAGRPRGDGIGVYQLAPSTGALRAVQTVFGVVNPSYLALGPGERTLYAVRETSAGAAGLPGAVVAFARNPVSGHLTLLNEQPSRGTDPCYVSIDPEGQFLFVANYSSGSVTCLPLGSRGQLLPASDTRQHQGAGRDTARQAGPHAHAILSDPTHRFVLAVDLGLDRVFVYQLDRSAGALLAHDPPAMTVAAGAGPRHLVFAPDGARAYLVNELNSTLSVGDWDARAGRLRVIQTLSTLPAGYHGANLAAAVRVSSSGQHVYVSNRGHDSIAIFARDAASGRLTRNGHVPSGGRTPRDFAIAPDGKLVLVANQDSNRIVGFHVDARTGALEPTGAVTAAPAPTCVVFATT